MSKQIKEVVTGRGVSYMLNVIGNAIVKALKSLLRGLALFLAMNDKVGYAMRDEDERTHDP